MVVKESVIRGSRKRFRTTITDLGGNAQDPDAGTCFVRLEKTGEYTYGSPSQWYLCSKLDGITGRFGADIWLPQSWTLGDYVARFKWEIAGVEDMDSFEWTLKRKDKPYDSRRGPRL